MRSLLATATAAATADATFLLRSSLLVSVVIVAVAAADAPAHFNDLDSNNDGYLGKEEVKRYFSATTEA